MKREAFLQVVSKESIEDFLACTQNPVSKPWHMCVTNKITSLLLVQKFCDIGTETISLVPADVLE